VSEKCRNSKKTFVFEQISGIIFLKIDFSDSLYIFIENFLAGAGLRWQSPR
jgi:hypothetical protein